MEIIDKTVFPAPEDGRPAPEDALPAHDDALPAHEDALPPHEDALPPAEAPEPPDGDGVPPARPKKARHVFRLAVLGAALFAAAAVSLILPLRPTQSVSENRPLAVFPSFSFDSLFSGDYFSGIAAWFSDTVPFRDTLTSLNARVQHLLGVDTARSKYAERAKAEEIPTFAPGETVTLPIFDGFDDIDAETTEAPAADVNTPDEEPSTEAPDVPKVSEKLDALLIYGDAGYEYYNFVERTAKNYSATVNRAAELVKGKATVYDIIIPTSMDIMLSPAVRETVSVSDQKAAIGYMETLLSGDVKKVSIYDTLLAHNSEYIYYRTDHHWTGLGAYYAYREFCRVKGVTPVELAECDYKAFDGFLGSFYWDSNQNPALGASPDTVETWMPPVNATMHVVEKTATGFRPFNGTVIYDASESPARYKYGAYIWGDNPLSVIENLDMETGESCLLVKESFGNAFAPFLTYNYKYVYVLDYREGYDTVSSLVNKYGITDVIFCNNISMTRSAGLVNNLYSSLG